MIEFEYEIEAGPRIPLEWSQCARNGFRYKCWLENPSEGEGAVRVGFRLHPIWESYLLVISPKTVNLAGLKEGEEGAARVVISTEKGQFDKTFEVKTVSSRTKDCMTCDLDVVDEGLERFLSKHTVPRKQTVSEQ